MSEFEEAYVHQVYESIAKPFDDTRFCQWNAVRNFLDDLPSGSFVLDNGCGNGKYLQYRPDCIFIGNDVCSGLLEIASRKGDVLRANGLSLPYKKDMFDGVICVAVFHHLSSHERRIAFLEEMIRVIKPGGKILITVWAMGQTHKRVRHWNVQENGDALIPWRNKDRSIQCLRYYHLFDEASIRVFGNHPQVEFISCHFEFDNWCLVLRRRNPPIISD